MEHKKIERDAGKGMLPGMAPLANAYVPFQMDGETQYEARKALIRGTLYPGLDLPFMGMVNKKPLAVTATSEMQTLGFAIQELALYLDTHRDDQEAYELYRKYQQMYQKSKEDYSRKKGPLNHMSPADGDKYEWLDDPWPWEYSRNKEV